MEKENKESGVGEFLQILGIFLFFVFVAVVIMGGIFYYDRFKYNFCKKEYFVANPNDVQGAFGYCFDRIILINSSL